jgi:hypothetical protein
MIRHVRLTAASAIAVSAVIMAANLWLSDSVFVPVTASAGTEYLLVSATPTRGLMWVALAMGLAIVLWKVGGHATQRAAFWTALSLVPLLNLHPLGAGALPAFSYVLYDLRLYWWGALALFIPRRRWLQSAGQHTLAVVLATVGVGVAIASTPHLRFSGALHGDEPKYVRYCETFYQGNGFDISKNVRLDDISGAPPPRVLNNLRHLATAIPEEAGQLFDDVRRVLGGAVPPRLRSGEPGPGMFFHGKHPGTVYQLHNPGVSFLLFPAYYLDRRITGSGTGYHGEFPANMPAVHATLLALYAAYGLALFALLRTRGRQPFRAFALALVGTIALPAGAFAFQIYPEISAGLIVFLLVRSVLSDGPANIWQAAAIGLLAGFLPWLHVRFGIVTLLAIAWTWSIPSHRTRRSSAIAVTAGAAILVAALCLYTYRLTGSLLPVATYGDEAPLSASRVLQGLPASALDAVWGVLPHSPIYLLALPGMGIAVRRRSRQMWALAVLLAVAIPAAGHGFWAGGSTPGRYLVAVMPLLLIFVARALDAWSDRRWFIGLVVVLSLLSLEATVTYNLTHRKEFGPLVAHAFSAWRPNLLFPAMGQDSWSLASVDLLLLLAWTGAAAGWLAWGWTCAGRRHAGETTTARVEPAGAPALVIPVMMHLLGLAVIGSLVGQLTGRGSNTSYLLPAAEARTEALSTFAAQQRCFICYSSSAGAVEPTVALGNDVSQAFFRIRPLRPRAETLTVIVVRPRGPNGEFVLADVYVETGDGGAVRKTVYGDASFEHVYKTPGRYEVRAVVGTPSHSQVQAATTVTVTATAVP